MKFTISATVETTIDVENENMLIEACEVFQDQPIGMHSSGILLQFKGLDARELKRWEQ